MPIYDRACDCGWRRDDCYEPPKHEMSCPECGAATVREWTSRVAVHGDDAYIGGQVIENAGHEPVTVYSRSERRRLLESRGLQEFVRHVGEPGSDRSSKTSRWV